MLFSQHFHGCRQWIPWFCLGFILSIASTAFALVISPSAALPSNSQGISPANPTESISLKTESPPHSLISATQKFPSETSPELDIHREAPIKTKGSSYLNDAPQTTEMKTLSTEGDSVPRTAEIGIVDTTEDTAANPYFTQSQKFPVVLSENRSSDSQTTVIRHDPVFVANDMGIENHSTIGEKIKDSAQNRFNFIMNFGDTVELKEEEQSTVNDSLNWFYKFLQQILPDPDNPPERFQINIPAPEEPVTEEQLKVWLQNVITEASDIFKNSIDNIPHGPATIISPWQNNLTVESIEVDSQKASNIFNNYPGSTAAGPGLENYGNEFHQDPYLLESGNSPDSLSESPPKHDLKKQRTDNNSAKHSFIVKFFNFIGKIIYSFKIWLHDLFHN